jgi:hypothetical protein
MDVHEIKISEELDALDALEKEKKEWMVQWNLRRDVVMASLNSFREDIRQMRLDLGGQE